MVSKENGTVKEGWWLKQSLILGQIILNDENPKEYYCGPLNKDEEKHGPDGYLEIFYDDSDYDFIDSKETSDSACKDESKPEELDCWAFYVEKIYRGSFKKNEKHGMGA